MNNNYGRRTCPVVHCACLQPACWVILIAESAELAPMQHSNYCRACYNASDGQKLKRNYFVTIAGTNPNPERPTTPLLTLNDPWSEEIYELLLLQCGWVPGRRDTRRQSNHRLYWRRGMEISGQWRLENQQKSTFFSTPEIVSDKLRIYSWLVCAHHSIYHQKQL